ncbi:MAG: hypothetical protein HQ481_05620 [Alphaproteobacteria bacterium]|nr:hypothetical protein [Alphaproteobacteria bacterium]
MTKTLHLRASKGATLRSVVDFIFDQKPEIPEHASKFEMIEGGSTEAGSGEDAIVELRLVFDAPTEEDLANIEEIIRIARQSADDIEITVN